MCVEALIASTVHRGLMWHSGINFQIFLNIYLIRCLAKVPRQIALVAADRKEI